jgi:hypothetical protein
VVQEGVESVLPFMTRQLMRPKFEDALQVLWRFAWPYKEMDHQSDFFRELIKHKNGCMVFVITGEEIAKHVTAFSAKVEQDAAAMSDAAAAPASASVTTAVTASSCRSIPICIWKTPHSLSLMISAVEQSSLLRLLDPTERFIPAEVKAKREAKLQEEHKKAEDRKVRQEAYEARAKQALAATAAQAAAATFPVSTDAAASAVKAESNAPAQESAPMRDVPAVAGDLPVKSD